MDKSFKVTGMGCASCVVHVQKAIKDLEGVAHCQVDLVSEKLNVRFDENMTSFDDMKNALEEAGYGLEKI